MSIASVADVILAEWEGGATDEALCKLLTNSHIRPPAPHGFRIWTPERLRLVAGERPRGEVRK